MAMFLHRGGNLQSFVNDYRNECDDYVTETLYDSLMRNLVYLRIGKPMPVLNHILSGKLNEYQLVDLLAAELRNAYTGEPGKDGGRGTFRRDEDVAHYDLDKYVTDEKIIYGELAGKIDVLTETRERLIASNPWRGIAEDIKFNEYENPTDAVHPKDRRIVGEFNGYAKEEHRLRLDVPPAPFQGNPLGAEVVILTLTGFVERCNIDMYNDLNEKEQKKFIKEQCTEMSLQGTLGVPDDKVFNIIGGHYWERKLKQVLKIPDANKKIAIVEFFGYSSTKYDEKSKQFFSRNPLHTQEYTFRLVRYLMQQGKVIVIARAVKEWYQHIPELENYDKKALLKLPLAITPGNCLDNGWELITAALAKG
jgi:hypothetical protein